MPRWFRPLSGLMLCLCLSSGGWRAAWATAAEPASGQAGGPPPAAPAASPAAPAGQAAAAAPEAALTAPPSAPVANALQQALAEAQAAKAKLEQREQAYLVLKGKLSQAGGKAPAELQAQHEAARLALEDQAAALRAAARSLEEAGGDAAPFRSAVSAALGEGAGPAQLTDYLTVDGLLKLAETWGQKAYHFVIDQGPLLLWQAFVVVLLWSLFGVLARFVKKLVRRGLSSPRIKASSLVKDFIAGIASNAVVIVGLLVILNQLGLQVGPLLAGFGVAGFIAGFALQDVLSNFAAGVMILFYRPFDVGDFVRAGGEHGTVREMSLVSTTLTTPDNQRLIVPNKRIWGDTIQNVTANPTRRVDMLVSIDYADDIGKALAVLDRAVKAHPKVLPDPAPVIRVAALADSGIEIQVRPWCNSPDYWDVMGQLNRQIKEAFDQAGITIPFPQRVVHVRGGPLP
jgi:small conductance mechanosensitive channel